MVTGACFSTQRMDEAAVSRFGFYANFRDGAGSAIDDEAGLARRCGRRAKGWTKGWNSPDTVWRSRELGQLQRFREDCQISAIRNLIGNWHVSDLHSVALRALAQPQAGVAGTSFVRGRQPCVRGAASLGDHRRKFDEILQDDAGAAFRASLASKLGKRRTAGSFSVSKSVSIRGPIHQRASYAMEQ